MLQAGFSWESECGDELGSHHFPVYGLTLWLFE